MSLAKRSTAKYPKTVRETKSRMVDSRRQVQTYKIELINQIGKAPENPWVIQVWAEKSTKTKTNAYLQRKSKMYCNKYYALYKGLQQPISFCV